MVITGSLTTSPRLWFVDRHPTSMRSSSSNWRTWKGSAAIDCSETSGRLLHHPGNSGGISQCSLPVAEADAKKSCCARAGTNPRRQTSPDAVFSITGCRSVISAYARRHRQHASGAADEQLGSSNISRSRFSAPLIAGHGRCSTLVRVTPLAAHENVHSLR